MLVVVAALWFGGGALVAYALCSDFPGPLASTLAAVGAVGLLIVAAHLVIVRIFPSREACLGMIVGKACALPLTGGFGLFSLAILAMSTDGGMEAAARIAYVTVPVAMGMTAIPAVGAAFIGAAIGQRIARRRG